MPKLIKVAGGTGGQASYTLAPGESWRLVSVVAELSAALVGTGLVPTLEVRDASGGVVASVSSAVSSS